MQDLARFTAAFHAHRTDDPDARLFAGLLEGLGDLPDVSVAAVDAAVERARGLRAALDRLDRSALSFDDRLDLDLAAQLLEAESERDTRELDGERRIRRLPRAGDALGYGLFLLMAGDPRPAPERLSDLLGRLRAVPRYLAQWSERITMPQARWRDIEVTSCEGLPELFATVVAWSADEGFSDHAALVAAAERAEAAVAAYLTDLRTKPTTDALHLGREAAERIVALRGIELRLDALKAIAVDFLERNALTTEALRHHLVARYELADTTTAEELHAFLNVRFAVPRPTGTAEDVLAAYRAERDRLRAWIERDDRFPLLDDDDMLLLETPPFLRSMIPAGAMVSPPPFRPGTRTSLIYLTLLDDRMDDHSLLAIPTMMLHEGIPGHHLQLATAGTHPSVIRRHVDAMDQAEGWTTMLEDYVLDEGYLGDLTEEGRYVLQADIARIGARVAIDLFFMTGERHFLDVGRPLPEAALRDPEDGGLPPFEAAKALLQQVTGFSDGRAEAELNWYSIERGYPLSYLTGNHLVWALKRDMARHRSDLTGLDLDRAFHRAFLEAGSMPVAQLRRWFADRGLVA